jgi:hypothetical protein
LAGVKVIQRKKKEGVLTYFCEVLKKAHTVKTMGYGCIAINR